MALPMIMTLPHTAANHEASKAIINAGVRESMAHIDARFSNLNEHEILASQSFVNGHDFEMRAIERGVPKDDLVKSRMAELTETHAVAASHVDMSASLVPHFQSLQQKLATTQPPPPNLARGMSVSDRTMRDLLTKDTVTNVASSSATLGLANVYSRNGIGAKDYRGEDIKHAVILNFEKATSAPIMDRRLGDNPVEREHVLPKAATYDIAKRELRVDRENGDRTVIITLREKPKDT